MSDKWFVTQERSVRAKNGSRLVYIGVEGEIQGKICKVVNFHFKPHKLFKCYF